MNMYLLMKMIRIHHLSNLQLCFRESCFSKGGQIRKLHLIHNKAFINGTWEAAQSGKTFEVHNPADGSVISSVPDMDESDAERAVKAAHKQFESWKKTTAKERGRILRNWYDLLVKNQDNLADIITAEAGKPKQEALGEVVYGNSFVDWFSEEARRINGITVPSPVTSKEIVTIRQPMGVAALITPWNFPIAMITRKAGAAIAAGCTCVVKPAEDTPLTALALADLAKEAGVPDGVFNVVTSNRENAVKVGKLFCSSPLVAGISFTGSTVVGKLLYEQCSSTVKRIGLELGGNAPFIVFKSADVNKAVEGAMASKFRNAGQTCVSANRILIQLDVYDEFVNKLKESITKNLKVGKGQDITNNIGPLINKSQMEKVSGLVHDAIKKGAVLKTGGKAASNIGNLYFEPTILTNVTPNMRIYNEEVFGPVAVCVPFESEEEALSIANNTPSGLAGYFYSNDIAQVWRVAKAMEVGMVGINEGLISACEAPFGGVKESGIGREGGHHGMEEFLEIKYMCFGNL